MNGRRVWVLATGKAAEDQMIADKIITRLRYGVWCKSSNVTTQVSAQKLDLFLITSHILLLFSNRWLYRALLWIADPPCGA
jgi:hypothetical protein